MRKILPVMVLLCLFTSIVVPISANEDNMPLPPRQDTEFDKDCPDNLVMPDEWGEVVILDNPEGTIGLPDMDGDGVPDDEDFCPTVPGDKENRCPSGENGGDAEFVGDTVDDTGTEEGDTGFPITIASILAGVVLAAIVVIGMAVRRKR